MNVKLSVTEMFIFMLYWQYLYRRKRCFFLNGSTCYLTQMIEFDPSYYPQKKNLT